MSKTLHQSWARFMTDGRRELQQDNLVTATRMFHHAEMLARGFGTLDTRRVVALSYTAVGYYKLGNYQLAEVIFKDVFQCYVRMVPCGALDEIAGNLHYLGLIYEKQGRKTEANSFWPSLSSNARQTALAMAVEETSRKRGFRPAKVSNQPNKDKYQEIRLLRQLMAQATDANHSLQSRNPRLPNSELNRSSKPSIINSDASNGKQKRLSESGSKWGYAF